MRSLRKVQVLALGGAALASGLSVGIWRHSSTPDSPLGSTVVQTDGLHVEAKDIDAVVRQSSIIVEGRFDSESWREVPVPGADGSVGLTRTDLVQTFVVTAVFSGDLAGAERVEVVTTATQSYSATSTMPEFRVQTDGVVPLKAGSTYLLFLATYADVGGKIVLGLAAEPGIALVKDDNLEFLTSPEGTKRGAGTDGGFTAMTRDSLLQRIDDIKGSN